MGLFGFIGKIAFTIFSSSSEEDDMLWVDFTNPPPTDNSCDECYYDDWIDWNGNGVDDDY